VVFWTFGRRYTVAACRCLSLVEDQAVHIAGEVGQRDLGLGAFDADGADEQPHLVLLPGEDVFDAGADLGLCGVGFGGPLGHRLAAWLPAVDGSAA
jgi:hypothetical protein